MKRRKSILIMSTRELARNSKGFRMNLKNSRDQVYALPDRLMLPLPPSFASPDQRPASWPFSAATILDFCLEL